VLLHVSTLEFSLSLSLSHTLSLSPYCKIIMLGFEHTMSLTGSTQLKAWFLVGVDFFFFFFFFWRKWRLQEAGSGWEKWVCSCIRVGLYFATLNSIIFHHEVNLMMFHLTTAPNPQRRGWWTEASETMSQVEEFSTLFPWLFWS
jgi:hypothetical protein